MIGPIEVLLVAGVLVVIVLVAVMVGSRHRSSANLVNCLGCGEGVSLHADKCPHCGRAMK
jgi:hypothetical protein